MGSTILLLEYKCPLERTSSHIIRYRVTMRDLKLQVFVVDNVFKRSYSKVNFSR